MRRQAHTAIKQMRRHGGAPLRTPMTYAPIFRTLGHSFPASAHSHTRSYTTPPPDPSIGIAHASGSAATYTCRMRKLRALSGWCGRTLNAPPGLTTRPHSKFPEFGPLPQCVGSATCFVAQVGRGGTTFFRLCPPFPCRIARSYGAAKLTARAHTALVRPRVLSPIKTAFCA